MPARREEYELTKTVRDACELQDNALSIELSDQIEQLDELIADEKDGSTFFERTHAGHAESDHEGIAHLAGRSSQAVFHLKQATGGGETHKPTRGNDLMR